MNVVKPNHLGGHLNMTHVDRGALEWLKSKGCKLFLDVGCSVGWQVAEALDVGMSAFGLDGDYSLLQQGLVKNPHQIMFSDFTKTHVYFPVQFDAIWCVEVAEHIEEQFTSNLLTTLASNLKRDGYLVFTANDGPGIHHVNLKPMSWWKEILSSYGLLCDEKLTEELRAASTMKREFIRETGIVCRFM